MFLFQHIQNQLGSTFRRFHTVFYAFFIFCYSFSALFLVDSLFSAATKTSLIFSLGIKVISSPSPTTKSPGLTSTPPQMVGDVYFMLVFFLHLTR